MNLTNLFFHLFNNGKTTVEVMWHQTIEQLLKFCNITILNSHLNYIP